MSTPRWPRVSYLIRRVSGGGVCKARAGSASAFQNARYRLQHNFRRTSLHDITVRARFLCLHADDLVVVHRYDDDFRCWRKPAYLPGGLNAAHHWHTDVHQHQVGFQRERRVDRFSPVARFAANLPASPPLDKAAQPRSDDLMIVDDQYSGASGIEKRADSKKLPEITARAYTGFP